MTRLLWLIAYLVVVALWFTMGLYWLIIIVTVCMIVAIGSMFMHK